MNMGKCMKNKTEISKYIALILRHKPETIGVKLDEHGWANVEELINGINVQYSFSKEDLQEISEDPQSIEARRKVLDDLNRAQSNDLEQENQNEQGE